MAGDLKALRRELEQAAKRANEQVAEQEIRSDFRAQRELLLRDVGGVGVKAYRILKALEVVQTAVRCGALTSDELEALNLHLDDVLRFNEWIQAGVHRVRRELDALGALPVKVK